MGDLDYSGADTVRQIVGELERRGARLVLCSVDPAVRKLLDAYGLTDKDRGGVHLPDAAPTPRRISRPRQRRGTHGHTRIRSPASMTVHLDHVTTAAQWQPCRPHPGHPRPTDDQICHGT